MECDCIFDNIPSGTIIAYRYAIMAPVERKITHSGWKFGGNTRNRQNSRLKNRIISAGQQKQTHYFRFYKSLYISVWRLALYCCSVENWNSCKTNRKSNISIYTGNIPGMQSYLKNHSCNTKDAWCNTKHTISNTMYISCNTKHTSCNTKHTSCNTKHISCNTKHISCNTKHISCNTKHTICNTKHISCNTKHTICNTKHAICNTMHTICNTMYISYNTMCTSCNTIHQKC